MGLRFTKQAASCTAAFIRSAYQINVDRSSDFIDLIGDRCSSRRTSLRGAHSDELVAFGSQGGAVPDFVIASPKAWRSRPSCPDGRKGSPA
jgi:hypothetical protein